MNFVIDGFLVMVFGFNFLDKDIMMKSSRRKDEDFLFNWVMFRYVVVGFYVGVVIVGVFVIWFMCISFMGIDLS